VIWIYNAQGTPVSFYIVAVVALLLGDPAAISADTGANILTATFAEAPETFLKFAQRATSVTGFQVSIVTFLRTSPEVVPTNNRGL
jgi:hypothetical protein